MQNAFQLLSNIFRGPWYIDETYAYNQLPLIEALLDGKGNLETVAKTLESFPIFADTGINLVNAANTPLSEALPDSIALIPVTGALMRADYCFKPGMATLGNWIQEADQNPNIIAKLLWVNSGGGTVDYTDVLAGINKNAVKPSVTYTDGIMASAAYWIGSTSDFIIVGSDTAVIGSIGTQAKLMKDTNSSLQVQTIRATKSSNKNEIFLQAEQGNTQPLIDKYLDPLNEVFLAAVQQNRAGKLKPDSQELLTGEIYIGASAIEEGLADARGTFEQAVQKALELGQAAKTQSTISFHNSSSNMKRKFLADHPRVAAFFGVSIPEGEASVEAEVSAEKDQELEAKLGELETLTTANAGYKTKSDALTAALATAGVETVEALIEDRNSWKTKAETYGAQPGATPTEAVKVGSDKIEEEAPKVELTENDKEAFAIFNLVNGK